MNNCLERVNDRHFWNPGVFSYAMILSCRPNSRVFFFFIVTSIVYGFGLEVWRHVVVASVGRVSGWEPVLATGQRCNFWNGVAWSDEEPRERCVVAVLRGNRQRVAEPLHGPCLVVKDDHGLGVCHENLAWKHSQSKRNVGRFIFRKVLALSSWVWTGKWSSTLSQSSSLTMIFFSFFFFFWAVLVFFFLLLPVILSNGTNVASSLANFFFISTCIVYAVQLAMVVGKKILGWICELASKLAE